MIVLYINNEHCTSIAQLKGYFSEDLTPDSDIYADLLDYGRYGDIAAWLLEQNEQGLSSKVASISTDLSDSAFYAELKGIITGVVSDTHHLKPSFDQCFSFENIKCEGNDTEVRVCVSLKVLMCVNEEYELSVSSNWGKRGVMVNPYRQLEGKTICNVFILHKRPGKDLGDITAMADGKVLSCLSKFSRVGDEITVDDVTFKMIHVEGGSFEMDTNYIVTLSSYSIGETPVTQDLWQAVMGNNPSYFEGAQRPVESVSWHDCKEFIEKLNQKTGRTFRLPTEAEWEYAARGGKRGKSYDYAGSSKIDEVAWYRYNSGNHTHPVKQKKANELALYDMSGNVWEWCNDWFDRYKYQSLANPTGPASGLVRVIRGGSWGHDENGCRSKDRNSRTPGCRKSTIGLRLVLSE